MGLYRWPIDPFTWRLVVHTQEKVGDLGITNDETESQTSRPMTSAEASLA
jgi:hypothetical protein